MEVKRNKRENSTQLNWFGQLFRCVLDTSNQAVTSNLLFKFLQVLCAVCVHGHCCLQKEMKTTNYWVATGFVHGFNKYWLNGVPGTGLGPKETDEWDELSSRPIHWRKGPQRSNKKQINNVIQTIVSSSKEWKKAQWYIIKESDVFRRARREDSQQGRPQKRRAWRWNRTRHTPRT